MHVHNKKISRVLICFASSVLVSACGKSNSNPGGSAGSVIQIDGSSTVFPITQAIAEEFQLAHKGSRVTVGVSGTGGGFKKFCRGEIAISGASRPIKPSELKLCKNAGVEFIELPVAYDGIAVVVNKKATWTDSITVAELKKMWSPEAEGVVKRWSDVREGWPETELKLLGPGVDSGTYDYFTKAIVGKEHSSRGDFAPNEDDNILVHGVSTDTGALGYFGYAYYKENKDKLKLLAIDNGTGAIAPSPTTVGDGTYQPLSRPIFIYVSIKELSRPEVTSFIDFYIKEGSALVNDVGYIAFPKSVASLVEKRFTEKVTGSMFNGKGSTVGVSVESMLSGK